MKRLLINIPVFLMLLIGSSCDDKEDCCTELKKGSDGDITGSWLLYEEGYSPGAGYIVQAVKPVPPQVIEFNGNGQFSSSVPGLINYKFYSIEDDVVGLFIDDPGPSPDSLAYSYNFNFEDNNLKLRFRYCYEGCHMAFRRIEPN